MKNKLIIKSKNYKNYMKQQKFMLLLFGILLISLTSAYLPHEQSTGLNISFAEPEADNCTITTIQQPNGSISTINQEMNENAENFDFYVAEGNFSNLGSVCINLYCCDSDANPVCEPGSICREVTSTGQASLKEGEGNILLAGIGIILLLSILFFILGMKSQNMIFTIIFLVLSLSFIFISALFSMVLIDNLMQNYPNIVEGYSTFIMVVKTMFTIGSLAILIYAGLVALRLWKIKRGFIDV